jgi:hypothetical protein
VELVSISVQVPKCTYEVEEGIKRFVIAGVTALADGWQPMQDIPVLVTSALHDLHAVAQNVDAVKEELKAYPEAMSRLAGLTVGDVVGMIVKAAE